MFSLCEAMKWSHLPLAGGIYAQDPQLLEWFRIIFSERSEYEAAKQADEAHKRRYKAPGGSRAL